ncbi:MAG TPA: YqeG family HAD IIIA-type phosphatase [Clostridiales bacterium]|jgi:HAD superfamily phosphatase (TIGR01668 family)|nr:YqeG family HAD IIIA-type phosphatase [Clostridiales bacterium]
MFSSLIPKFRVKSIFDLSPELLMKHGISLVLTDLDNTLAPYSGQEPSDKLIKWKNELSAASIDIFIVSNTRTERAKKFSALWGVPYIDGAKKPSPDALIRAARRMNRAPGETLLIGDQIFTDVWSANRAGVLSVIVEPLKLTNVFYILRYIAELPFRAFAKKFE